MSSKKGLYASMAVAGMLLAMASPAFAAEFAPEGGAVTGVGGEARIFTNQITCTKTKMTGKITKIPKISKIEGPTEFEGCTFGAKKVTNFTSPELGLNGNQTVSFRETKIEVEGGCLVTIVAGGLNLLLKQATFVNVPGKKVLATINVPGNEESGILYETNKNKECGTLAEKEKTLTAYWGAEVINEAEVK